MIIDDTMQRSSGIAPQFPQSHTASGCPDPRTVTHPMLVPELSWQWSTHKYSPLMGRCLEALLTVHNHTLSTIQPHNTPTDSNKAQHHITLSHPTNDHHYQPQFPYSPSNTHLSLHNQPPSHSYTGHQSTHQDQHRIPVKCTPTPHQDRNNALMISYMHQNKHQTNTKPPYNNTTHPNHHLTNTHHTKHPFTPSLKYHDILFQHNLTLFTSYWHPHYTKHNSHFTNTPSLSKFSLN